MRILVFYLVSSLLLLSSGIYNVYHILNDVIDEDSFYSEFLKLNDEDYASSFKKQWLEPPVRETMSLYLFRQLNAKDVSEKVAPVGPFNFTVKQEKQIIQETANELTYRAIVRYFLNSSQSENVTERIRMPNIPFFAAKHMAETILNVTRSSVIEILMHLIETVEHTTRIVEHQVNEFTFDGYSDELISLINDLQVMGVIKDKVITDGKFSLLSNETNSGAFTVDKGIDSIKKTGQIIAWNGMRETGFYGRHSSCNKVFGSNGQNFGAFLDETEKLFVFIPEFCSAVPFKFARETTTLGLSTRRYEFSFSDDGLDRCFASNGMHDASKCNHMAPIVLTAARSNSNSSAPHQGDEVISFLEVEATTGVTIRASINFQVNLILPINSSNETIVTPLMQIERNAEAEDDAINSVNRLKNYHLVLQIIVWILSILAITLLCVIVLHAAKQMFDKMRPQDAPLLENSA